MTSTRTTVPGGALVPAAFRSLQEVPKSSRVFVVMLSVQPLTGSGAMGVNVPPTFIITSMRERSSAGVGVIPTRQLTVRVAMASSAAMTLAVSVMTYQVPP